MAIHQLNYQSPDPPRRVARTLEEIERDLRRQRRILVAVAHVVASYVALVAVALWGRNPSGLLHPASVAAPVIVPFVALTVIDPSYHVNLGVALDGHPRVCGAVYLTSGIATFLGLWIPWRSGARIMRRSARRTT